MALIRARDTKPEMRVRRSLHAQGLRYRLHAADLPGRPDIVFRSRRIVILVHGCFWHQHPDPNCRLARMPKSRLEFWAPKLNRNRSRDEEVKAKLEARGWRVIEVWECQLDQCYLAELGRMIRAASDRVLTSPDK
jgi:DNA mismatch endonuclease, patch repair protein